MDFRTLFVIAFSASAGFYASFLSGLKSATLHSALCLMLPLMVLAFWRSAPRMQQVLATLAFLLLAECFRFIPIRFGSNWEQLTKDGEGRLWLAASFAAPFAIAILAHAIARPFISSRPAPRLKTLNSV